MLVERWEESYERRFIFYPVPILTKTNKTLAVMQVDFRSGVYIFSRSRGVYWAAELLLLRIRERRETFGLEGSSQRWTITVLALSPCMLLVCSSYVPRTLLIRSSYVPHIPKAALLSPLKAKLLSQTWVLVTTCQPRRSWMLHNPSLNERSECRLGCWWPQDWLRTCLGDSVLITKTRRRKKEHFNNS